MSEIEKIIKEMAKRYLDVAEVYADLAKYFGEDALKQAVKYVKMATELTDSNQCIPCMEKKANNLKNIIRELKKLLG